MLNKQEVFDKVARHLLTQNEKSFNSNDGACAYRGYKERKCAIGCLIKDEFYNKEIEGKLFSHNSVVKALKLSGYEVEHLADIDFLSNLQLIHDQGLVQYWSRYLKKLADIYYLNYNVLKEFDKGV